MLYLIIYARDCKPDSKSQPEFRISFLCLLRRKSWFFGLGFWPQFVSQTGLKQAGGIYNEARSTTGLTIYGFLSAAEKTLFFFLSTKPTRNPLKKRSDHSFYHRQTRNTRKQWTKKAPRSSALEWKRYESTQSAREDRPTSVGVVEAAGSSPVTQIMIESRTNRFRLYFFAFISTHVRIILSV